MWVELLHAAVCHAQLQLWFYLLASACAGAAAFSRVCESCMWKAAAAAAAAAPVSRHFEGRCAGAAAHHACCLAHICACWQLRSTGEAGFRAVPLMRSAAAAAGAQGACVLAARARRTAVPAERLSELLGAACAAGNQCVRACRRVCCARFLARCAWSCSVTPWRGLHPLLRPVNRMYAWQQRTAWWGVVRGGAAVTCACFHAASGAGRMLVCICQAHALPDAAHCSRQQHTCVSCERCLTVTTVTVHVPRSSPQCVWCFAQGFSAVHTPTTAALDSNTPTINPHQAARIAQQLLVCTANGHLRCSLQNTTRCLEYISRGCSSEVAPLQQRQQRQT
jgi:hypothetical protein